MFKTFFFDEIFKFARHLLKRKQDKFCEKKSWIGTFRICEDMSRERYSGIF